MKIWFIEFCFNKNYRIEFKSREEIERAVKAIGTGTAWEIEHNEEGEWVKFFRYYPDENLWVRV